MAKNSIRDYSATASSNTDVQSVNIDENCPASGINNAIREVMADLKNVSTGAIALESPAFDSVTGPLAVSGAITATTDDNTSQLTLTSTDADASAGPRLDLKRDSGSPADNDTVGRFRFLFDNDAAEETEAVRIDAFIPDVSDGTEDATFQTLTMVGGTMRSRVEHSSTETVFNQDSVDIDFRVESDGNANMLFVDASSNVVLIGSTDTSPFNNTSDTGTSLSGGDVQIASSSSESLYLNRIGSDGRVVSIRKGGSFIGGIDVSTSQVTYNQTSDYRLKENVSYTWDATARLKQLKPARFNYIVDADNTVDGFLAHEVSEACPQAISGAKDAVDADGNIEPQCIDHSKLVPLLCKTILELEARITALETA